MRCRLSMMTVVRRYTTSGYFCPYSAKPSQPLYILSYLVEAIECLVMDVGGVLLSIDDGGGEECAAI